MDLDDKDREFPEGFGLVNHEQYHALLYELSSLTRLERVGFAESYFVKFKQTRIHNERYRLYIPDDEHPEKAYLLFFSNGTRSERFIFFTNLVHRALAQSQCDKIIGIATEGAKQSGRSFDFAVVKRSDYSEQQLLEYMEPRLFNPIHQRKNIDEWSL